MITIAAHPQQRAVLARSAPITLGPIDTSPRTARASARAQLSAWGRAELAADVEEIVSELVTNAVKASERDGTAVALRMILTSVSVVVEVFDRAPGVPVAYSPGAEAESGRGLQIVAALAARWGWSPAGNAKGSGIRSRPASMSATHRAISIRGVKTAWWVRQGREWTSGA
jgi:anti-sigma regulatory factor (Ser/Thr protein kinase)